MSRKTWIAILTAGAIVGSVLGTPLACWQAECPAEAEACMGSGCDNLLGMTVESGRSYVGPILASVLPGVAVAWLIGVAISKLRPGRA